MKLILFDIDGTLLSSDGAGRRAMEHALTERFGTPGAPGYRYDGKTDRQIVREQMRAAGFTDDDIDDALPQVEARYLEQLQQELASPAIRARAYVGVFELLEALRPLHDRVVGLLTGNVAMGADLKLRAVGIDPSQFRVTAFGSDHEVRSELPGIAQARARDALGLEFDGDRLIIVGDTPSDIACGRPVGARAIAVATGQYSVDELASHAPAFVFPDLADTAAVLAAIADA
ncbi:MAG: haloacid dehalogenase-like hydrolase [Gemmatimonadaceae bacterium]